MISWKLITDSWIMAFGQLKAEIIFTYCFKAALADFSKSNILMY